MHNPSPEEGRSVPETSAASVDSQPTGSSPADAAASEPVAKGRPAKVEAASGTVDVGLDAGLHYQRFDPFSRFLHLLVIISFLSLAVTGMTAIAAPSGITSGALDPAPHARRALDPVSLEQSAFVRALVREAEAEARGDESDGAPAGSSPAADGGSPSASEVLVETAAAFPGEALPGKAGGLAAELAGGFAGVERVGDVSNVVFSNGVAVRGEEVFIYYASCDTRLHVATSSIPALLDYAFNTPRDARRTGPCTQQRIDLIERNLAYAQAHGLNVGQR